ncbi:MAG: hypothetical protein RCG15_01460 [Candidatus Rickettsia vulgarisii]
MPGNEKSGVLRKKNKKALDNASIASSLTMKSESSKSENYYTKQNYKTLVKEFKENPESVTSALDEAENNLSKAENIISAVLAVGTTPDNIAHTNNIKALVLIQKKNTVNFKNDIQKSIGNNCSSESLYLVFLKKISDEIQKRVSEKSNKGKKSSDNILDLKTNIKNEQQKTISEIIAKFEKATGSDYGKYKDEITKLNGLYPEINKAFVSLALKYNDTDTALENIKISHNINNKEALPILHQLIYDTVDTNKYSSETLKYTTNYYKNDIPKALICAKKLANFAEKEGAYGYLLVAKLYGLDSKDGKENLTKAIKKDPDVWKQSKNTELSLHLYDCYKDQELFDKAKMSLQRCYEIGKDKAKIDDKAQELAKILRSNKEYEIANQVLKMLLENTDNDVIKATITKDIALNVVIPIVEKMNEECTENVKNIKYGNYILLTRNNGISAGGNFENNKGILDTKEYMEGEAIVGKYIRTFMYICEKTGVNKQDLNSAGVVLPKGLKSVDVDFSEVLRSFGLVYPKLAESLPKFSHKYLADKTSDKNLQDKILSGGFQDEVLSGNLTFSNDITRYGVDYEVLNLVGEADYHQ